MTLSPAHSSLRRSPPDCIEVARIPTAAVDGCARVRGALVARTTRSLQTKFILDRPGHASLTSGRACGIEQILNDDVYDRVEKVMAAQMRHTGLPDQERDDIRSEILLKLMVRLDEIARDSSAIAIESLDDYVAVVAFNTVTDFGRRLHPLRTKLKGRVRYALTHERRFAIWETPQGWAAGLDSWVGRGVGVFAGDPAFILHGSPETLRNTLLALFRAAGHPLFVDDVVTAVAEIEGIANEGAAAFSAAATKTAARSVIDDLQTREDLQHVWAEVRTLPLRQRVALLLHARDSSGESATRLLPSTLTVSFADLAETLGMTTETLSALWDCLPLDDLSIASRLGLQRQQVINLRRSARDRLIRRTRDGQRV